MPSWTLESIGTWAIWIVGFGAAVWTIIKAIRSAIQQGFKPIGEKIDKVDMNATKNYLVSVLDDVKSGRQLNDISRQRFHEQYQHYIELHGNSYVKVEVERLIKENKI